MVARKKRRAPRKKLGTRLKQNPIGTIRAEYKKLGIIGKGAVIGIAAGALTPAAATALDTLPVVGKFMRIFTGYGRKLGMKLK